ncbi:MAG: hypothetical protein IKH16_01295, partial [Selenomonadaceae bacterium]|nr:hypothetical protein [Selenomonadaceae bacterium]
MDRGGVAFDLQLFGEGNPKLKLVRTAEDGKVTLDFDTMPDREKLYFDPTNQTTYDIVDSSGRVYGTVCAKDYSSLKVTLSPMRNDITPITSVVMSDWWSRSGDVIYNVDISNSQYLGEEVTCKASSVESEKSYIFLQYGEDGGGKCVG